VGGGGMLAGVASYVKAIKPDVKIIGVEAEDAAGYCKHKNILFICYPTNTSMHVNFVGDKTFHFL
jgi:cysteine synthase